MKIGFVHKGFSYLPELYAYCSYFNRLDDIEASIISNNEMIEKNNEHYDLIWKFPGIDLKRDFKDSKVIHEYNSISTGDFVYLKNYLKKIFNLKPDARVFLNDEVKKGYGMNDDVPYIKRDMGISKHFFVNHEKKEYDFVYVGAMGKSRGLIHGLKPFTSFLKNRTILLIGKPNDALYQQYKQYANIIFIGKLSYEQVPSIASKAMYGYNFIPDVYPFNIQTSTKLLEYCAMGLNIVTTDYHWVRQFEQQNGGRFFKLQPDMKNFTNDSLEKFRFETPDVSHLEWDHILDRLGIAEFVKRIVN
nr:hypothetical protein [Lysinibacillus timonensis]